MKKLFAFISLVLIFAACNEVDILEPGYPDGSILSGTTPVPEEIRTNIEGVYKITDGKDNFGEQVVLKWYKEKLVVYGYYLGTYLVLESGMKNSEVLFEGVWRHMRSLDAGMTRWKITAEDAAALENGAVQDLEISGSYSNGNGINTKTLKLKYERAISDSALNSDFLIVAHRGGVRNSDNIGVSENSIEMIALAEQLGANAIEIDVKLSKDNVPFLYHDSDINLRLVREAPMWGQIEDFTFPQINTFLTLVNGEKIPKLKDALEFVLNETKLKFVWLDMKSSKNAMPYVIPIQQEIMSRAEAMGRDLKIVIGLPTEEKISNFKQYPGYENVLSLNELSIDDVRSTNSYAWGPRWTLGSQTDAVRQMHAEGRIAITWTLDSDEFIKKFFRETEFDGFVTNYPTVVAYYNYVR